MLNNLSYKCATSLSYLDVLITVDNGRYSTAVFDKRDSFTFNIVNFPHLSSNILSKPVYISQLVHVRIARICSNFVQFKLRHYTLTHEARILVLGIVYGIQEVCKITCRH